MQTKTFRNLLILIYTLSGMAALAYEVLWTRMLSLLFGISIFGVVVTVSAFMVGLGCGSLLAVRLRCSARVALRWFAMIEGCIAVYALALPTVMHGVDGLLGGNVAPGLASWYRMQGMASFALVCIPALGMGAGFPLVLKAVAEQCSLGIVYGMNTMGGVLGALLPLAMLPALGWPLSVRLVAGISVVVCVGVWRLSRYPDKDEVQQTQAGEDETQQAQASEDEAQQAQAGESETEQAQANEGETQQIQVKPGLRPDMLTLFAYAGIGAASLTLEVAWTRLYGMLMLRTEYVLAVILAVFLAGIGIGSLWARRADPGRYLMWMPVLTAVFVLLSLYELPLLAKWVESLHAASLYGAMLKQGAAIMACTLPVTLLLGAWLPLLSRQSGDAHASGAWLYGVNSAGAALGAVLAGFVLLPRLGTAGTLCVAAMMLFLCGMVWVEKRSLWFALPLVCLAIWPVHRLPEASVLLPQELAGGRNIMAFEDAVSITHTVELLNGQRLLLSDLHRMDASTDPTAIAVQKNQARLPLLLFPQPQSILFLGLGTGITASASLVVPALDRTAVELSAGAIAAAETRFDRVNRGIMQHMRVVRDDARRFLRVTPKHYDIILGDLFHPDMVGRSALLSVQQFERGRKRLDAGGIYVQWLALNQFDAPSLKSVLSSFRKIFPHGGMFVDGFRLALVGARVGAISAASVRANMMRLDAGGKNEVTGNEGMWTWLGRYWGPIPETDAPPQDEWSPVIEFSLPRARYGGDIRMTSSLGWLLHQRVPPTVAMRQLHIASSDRESFMRAYAATSLNMQLEQASLTGRERQAQQLAQLAYQANPRDRWAGFALADRMYATLADAGTYGYDKTKALNTILAIRPDHIGALKSLLRLTMKQGDYNLAGNLRQRILKLSPLDAEMRGMTLPDASDTVSPNP